MGNCSYFRPKLTEEDKQLMKHPHVVKKCPLKKKLEIGREYLYCTCGLSNNQPFCDGEHKGTPYLPVKFVATRETYFICMCKQTKKAPFCDGSHKDIDF